MNEKFRYELKYICSEAQSIRLMAQLEGLLQRDSHTGTKGYYTVRSLYFDDYENSSFGGKEDGIDMRKKYRLRSYDNDPGVISLEIKERVRDKIRKKSCRILKREADIIRSGEWYKVMDSPSPVVEEFFFQGALHLMSPKVIVEYDRIPYICDEGNVRVTLDKNIRSASAAEDFWETTLCTRPILPKGQQLLEVMFDEFLPDYIYQAMQLDDLRQTAFSKYYLCRKFSI